MKWGLARGKPVSRDNPGRENLIQEGMHGDATLAYLSRAWDGGWEFSDRGREKQGKRHGIPRGCTALILLANPTNSEKLSPDPAQQRTVQ